MRRTVSITESVSPDTFTFDFATHPSKMRLGTSYTNTLRRGEKPSRITSCPSDGIARSILSRISGVKFRYSHNVSARCHQGLSVSRQNGTPASGGNSREEESIAINRRRTFGVRKPKIRRSQLPRLEVTSPLLLLNGRWVWPRFQGKPVCIVRSRRHRSSDTDSRELQTVGWVSLSSVVFLRAEVFDAVVPEEDVLFVSVFTPAFFSTDCFLPACFLRTAFCLGASKCPLFTHARTVNHVVRNFFAACPKLMPSRTAATTCRRKSSLYVGRVRFRVRFLSVPVISSLLTTILGERGIVVLRNSGVVPTPATPFRAVIAASIEDF